MDQGLPTSAHHIKKSVVPLVGRVSATVFLANAAYLGFLAFFFVSGFEIRPIILLLFLVIAVAIFLLQSVLVVFLVVDWAKTDYYLMPDKIVEFRGIIVAREIVCDLRHIRTMTLRQGWLGRSFNYGTLFLKIGPEVDKHDYLELLWILHPKQCERAIRAYHEKQMSAVSGEESAKQSDEETREHYLKVPRIIA
ncbi:MAG: hypothetical protein WC817_03785 [Patescibacteria group bacterium]|jgi:uncharacterized membrane protein YdbT with pleckstrin-like domain